MFYRILNIIEKWTSNISHLCKIIKKMNNTSKPKYSRKVKKILEKYGNKKIITLKVCRDIIPNIVVLIADLVSFGDYSSKMKQHNVVNSYHVWFEFELEELNKTIIFEKNNIINAYTINQNNDNANNKNCITINLKKDFSLNNFLNNGLAKIGKTNFHKYDLSNFNCQLWCLKLLEANDIEISIYKDFIEQSFYCNLKNKEFINKVVNLLNFNFNIKKLYSYLNYILIILLVITLIIFYFILKNIFISANYFISIIKPIKISFANYHYELN